MSVEGIEIARANDIVTVTLARPERRNAVTFAMWQAMTGIFTDLADDSSLRGVILTGAGDFFSAGADIADFAHTRATMQQGIVYEEAVDAACDAIAALGRPVIAAIRGFCYGGACNLAMACDFRFLAPDARMAIPAAKLSIVYGVRGTARLLALVGVSEAKRVFFSAKPFDAEHALKSGFGDAIDNDPVTAATAWLSDTAELAPLSIAGAKEILTMLAMQDLAFDPARAEAAIMRALTSADYAEGRAAFGEKRAPRFRGC